MTMVRVKGSMDNSTEIERQPTLHLAFDNTPQWPLHRQGRAPATAAYSSCGILRPASGRVRGPEAPAAACLLSADAVESAS